MNALRFALGIVLLSSGSFANAQDKNGPSAEQAPALDARQRAQKAFRDGETRIAFEMRKKPWNEVIEWLVDQSGLIYIATQAPPTGTFNFISPKGSTYSGPEVIDIINEGLLQHQYVLIRRVRSFTLVSADNKQVDPWNVARIAAADLKKRGETELVQIVVTLQILNADEYAHDVKKQMGPHGSVVPLPVANQLILTDTAGNLLRIVETIDGIEKNKDDVATHAYKCVYVKASVAEAILNDILGDPRPALDGPRGPANPAAGDRAAPKAAAAPRSGTYTLKADDRTNTLLMNGRPNKIAQAKAYLATIDQPQDQDQRPLRVGRTELITYDVPAGNAESLVKILSDTPAYRPTQSFRMYAVNPTRILVYGGPEEQSQIAKELNGHAPEPLVTETVPLAILEAGRVADSLRSILGDGKGSAPYIEGDASRNVVLVHGSKDQVSRAKDIIQAMGENPAAIRMLRVFQLERGGSATLAAMLKRSLREIVPGVEVKIMTPGFERPLSDPGFLLELKRESQK